MSDNRQRVRQVFMEIADLPAADQQAALIHASRGDAALRMNVEALLRAKAQSDGFMASPTEVACAAHWEAASHPNIASTPHEQPGQMIGRYKLLELIGEGGFGSVWMAEQREPVKRRVALKVIKLGMDTRQVVARFEAERQALATMEHPNIAKVLDAGSTEAGRPYFVMEYINGVPIVEYCDTNTLDTRARLELFGKVCHAIQHAHQKGVIHRDIKPSNVLVTLHDGAPVPKVIDFGIAKATDSELTQKTLFTEHRQLVGTPAYMSPEQAELSGLDVDTRSDIYALGVLLYELLTGTTPFDSNQLRAAAFGEIQRIIREVEPPKPSTRISTLGTTLATTAAHRRAEPRQLGALVRGDLDWIVMKCLEKDRARRYESASALATDVLRHLTGDPVVAAPPSHLYRLSKTLRRHRTAAAVATIFVLLVAAALVATSTLWRQAAHARDAESGQRARAGAVSAFLAEMLTAADPAKAKGASLTVREALDRAAKNIDEGPVQAQPLVEAEIRFTIGSTYLALGLLLEAESHLRAADAIQSRELGGEHRDTLRTRFTLADTLARKSDYAGTAALAQPTMETQARVLGSDDPDTLQSMVLLGRVLWAQPGRYFDAESLLRSAVERLEHVRGPDHPDTADAMDWLGELYAFNSYPENAEPLHMEALRINTRERGAEHPSTLNSMHLLSVAIDSQLRHDEAETIIRETFESRLRVLGPEHIDTLLSQANLALVLARQGRYTEAEPIYRENHAAILRTVGADHIALMTGKRFLADCLTGQGRLSEAESLLREALDVAVRKYGPEEADTSIRLMCELASLLARQRKDAEAEQVARQVLEVQRRQLPRPEPGALTQSSLALIRVLKRRGASDEALRVEQELIEFWLAAARETDASAKILNGAARRLLDPSNEQLRDAPRALELALQANRPSSRQNPYFLYTLAKAYLLTGDSARAAQVWEQAMTLLRDDRPRAVMLNDAAWELLTATPETARDPVAALRFALRANELSGYSNAAQLDTLALAHHQTGATGKAIEVQQKALALLAPDDPDRAACETQLREYQAAHASAHEKREK